MTDNKPDKPKRPYKRRTGPSKTAGTNGPLMDSYEFAEMLGLSVTTVRAWTRAETVHRAPVEPVYVGPRAIRWRRSDVAKLLSGELGWKPEPHHKKRKPE